VALEVKWVGVPSQTEIVTFYLSRRPFVRKYLVDGIVAWRLRPLHTLPRSIILFPVDYVLLYPYHALRSIIPYSFRHK
jgi:hypothetical protein